MDTRSPLHWSALLLGLFAASWMLISLIGGLVFLLPLFAIAGFVLALVAARRLPDEKDLMRAGAAIGLVVYGLWVLLVLAAQPVSIKDVGTHKPPVFLSEASETLGRFLPSLGAIAMLVAFWPIWRTVERALGGIGTGLVLLVQILSLAGVTGDETVAFLLQAAFAVGWLALLIAALLPILKTDDAHPAWSGGSSA